MLQEMERSHTVEKFCAEASAAQPGAAPRLQLGAVPERLELERDWDGKGLVLSMHCSDKIHVAAHDDYFKMRAERYDAERRQFLAQVAACAGTLRPMHDLRRQVYELTSEVTRLHEVCRVFS